MTHPNVRDLLLVAAACALAACAGTRATTSDIEAGAPAPPPAEEVWRADDSAEDVPRSFVTYEYKIAGLTCPIRCTAEVKAQLREVPGVLDVFLDYDTRKVRVNAVPGTDPEMIARSLRQPYSARLLSD